MIIYQAHLFFRRKVSKVLYFTRIGLRMKDRYICMDSRKMKRPNYISILLSILLLFSSTGFKVNFHFCQGSLNGISLLSKITCCQDLSNDGCFNEMKSYLDLMDNRNNTSNNCCENKTLSLEPMEYDMAINFQLDGKESTISFLPDQLTYALKTFGNWAADVKRYQLYRPPFPDINLQS